MKTVYPFLFESNPKDTLPERIVRVALNHGK